MLVGIMALFPAVGHALALGKLKVLSALNEPLNAEIEFTSVTEKELKGLTISLASRSDFNDAGVERLPFLSELKFVVDRKPDGRHFLRLHTDQQIDEPFLHLLLQVEWTGGRLVREYAALIDPPYKVTGKAAPVETPVVTPPAPETAPAPMPEAQPAPPPAPVAEAPRAEPPKEEAPPVVAKPEEPKIPEEPKAEAVPPKEEVAKEVPPPATVPEEQKLGPPEAAQGAAPEEPAAPKVEPLEAAPKAEAAPEARPTMEPETKPAPAPVLAQMTEYSVKRGDTLWRIAEKTRVDNRDVSVEQMILAIYRTNKNAFFGNNVNNLKAGKILKMPEREQVESVTSSQARREFRAQYDAWQEYKLKLASASGAVKVAEAPEAAPEAAPAKPVPAPEPKKEPAKPSKAAPTATDKGKQDELLKIVRSTLQQQQSAPDQKVAEKESAKEAATREQQALAERAATLEESLESKRLENKELSDKVGLVRSQLKKESRLIELENQSLTQQPKPAVTKPAEPVVKPPEPAPKPVEKAAAPAPEEKKVKVEPSVPAKPVPAAPKKKAPLPAAPPEEKDFLATVLEAVQSDLLMPAVIGIVVLLSGGIALVYFRRRQKSIAEFEESILSADAISTEQPATTGTVVGQQPAAATTGGDTSFLSDFSQGGMGNIHTDEVDPIAEAEVYLAYGRDETAEEILKEAMVKNPDRQEIKLKLLEIYHQRNDVSAFETLAEELYAAQGGRGGKIWEKVEEMGRKLNPDNPMFRGGAPGKTPPGAAPAKPATVAKAAPAAATATAPAAVDSRASATETAKTEMAGDFDFDMETPAAEEARPAGADDFSVAMPETPPKAKAESSLESLDLGGEADSALDFGIGGGESPAASAAGNEIKWEPEPAAAPTAAAEVDLEAPAGESSAQWDEAATKLDLAKAYIDMGDAEGARSILQEVMAEGSEVQKKQAQELSSQIA
ncbi:MAG: LysM peptidoglycan-binding domain-containing protein [Gammaproteobacteria bacterium]|nr:LysM peptidoglycan-binding domain-containing protein [Gammaproteobacteria bacterium]